MSNTPQDYTQRRLEFEEEVSEELGYVSAIFMTQECKGTEIVMPSTELKEVSDRIGLYAFSAIQEAIAEERKRVKDWAKSKKDLLTMKWDNDKAKSTVYDSIIFNWNDFPVSSLDKEIINPKGE